MNGWYEAALTDIAVKSDHLRHRYLLYVTNNGGLKLFFYCIVPDPWHFGVDPDPDPRIHVSD